MNTNKFACLIEDDKSDDLEKKSIIDEPNEFIEYEQAEQTEQSGQNNEDTSVESYSVLTEANLALLNARFAQICTPEEEIIVRAKNKLLNNLVSRLRDMVFYEGFKCVYKPSSIFELLNGQPIYNFIRPVAQGNGGFFGANADSYEGQGVKLFQYKYFETIINIVVTYSWGSCSHCDEDLALEESLCIATTSVIIMELERDLRNKFDSFKFFLDFKEASAYIKRIGRCSNISIIFMQNPKKIEENQKKKEDWVRKKEENRLHKKEEFRRFGNYKVPTTITFGDFIPKNFSVSNS